MTTTPEKAALYNLGYFPRLHGYKGELTATLNTANVKDYENLENIFVEIKGELIPFVISLIEYKTNTTTKVKIEGIDNEEQAKNLVKCGIYIHPEDMSADDQEKEALRAIKGFKVVDEVKGLVGTVARIEEHNNNPLLVIQAGKKEVLIPLNEEFFKKVDRRKKEVQISAPEGLIDFYLGM